MLRCVNRVLAGLAICFAACSSSAAPRPDSEPLVELQPAKWLFKHSQKPCSLLTRQSPQAEFAAPTNAELGFTAEIDLDLKDFGETKNLLEIPEILSLRLRQHDAGDRTRQNYPAFKMPDGRVPVLEATLLLHSLEHPNWTNMTIGVPLAMLKKPLGRHQVLLSFTGVDWKLYVDGEMRDNDFPFGYPKWKAINQWSLDPNYASRAALYFPALKAEQLRGRGERSSQGIQYWTPPGHNNWVGDVETCFYKGRYHVFYLYDRRHHGSKFGCGAHYFEHLSTVNFKTWTEHEAATPLEQQWECIGTGVPFVWSNQLCLSYGLHTTRVYPEEKTLLPAQWEYLRESGHTGQFAWDGLAKVPAGATYSVSGDGVSNFRKSHILFHPCQNPSVYIDPKGKLRMIANYGSKGSWESESLERGWRCVNPDFPPGGDCTIYFRWRKFDYIIGGFTGLWKKPTEGTDSSYVDLVSRGLDFYDGSNVPAITEIDDGRFLMAAWIPIRGWGGPLVIRELLQYPDGRIASKWMEEITPRPAKWRTLATNITETTTFNAEGKSFMCVFSVAPADPNAGRMGVSFLPQKADGTACELQVDLTQVRAQFGAGFPTGFAGQEKSLREGGAPQQAGNYAIENLVGVDRPFLIRLIVKHNEKLGGSLIDVEIAGQRTMISYRPDLTVKQVLFRTEKTELKQLRIANLQEH